MTLSTDDHRSNEDFAVRAAQRPDAPFALVARGRLTAAGGELLYGAVVNLCEQAGDRLVVDLTAVTGVEPAGWAWLLPAMQRCRSAGCQLLIEPPGGGANPTDADEAPQRDDSKPAPPGSDHDPVLPGGDHDPTPLGGEPATLRCYPDGPILVRGNFELLGRDSQRLPRNRSVLALCRCGGSAIKPFCDGTHKTTRFSDG